MSTGQHTIRPAALLKRALAALRGSERPALSSYDDKHPSAAIASVPDFTVKELELTSFAGEPVYLASNSAGDTRIIPVHGTADVSFDAERIMRLVRETVGGDLTELRVMEEYDAYYLDRRRERPLPVIGRVSRRTYTTRGTCAALPGCS